MVYVHLKNHINTKYTEKNMLCRTVGCKNTFEQEKIKTKFFLLL